MERPAILPSRISGSPWNPTPAQAGGHSVHVAQNGDTLETIAHQYGAPVEAVRQVNPQIRDTGNVATGESINLPSGYNAPVQGGSTSSFPVDSGTQTRGGSTNLPAAAGPPAFGGSTSLPGSTVSPGHGGLLDLPINLGAPAHGAPVNYSVDSGLPTHTFPAEPPQFQPGSQASPPLEALPVDTTPRPSDVPRGEPLPRDTSPPTGNPLPRNDSPPAGAAASKADAAPTNPLPTTVSDPRGSVARPDASGAFPTDKAALATANAARTTANGETIINARTQAAVTILAAPLAALPSSNGAMRGDAAIPLRSFDGAPPTATTAKDIPQNAGTERRDMPRSAEPDARAMPQARNESEKMNYDAARLLRDVQARILSDPRAPLDVPGRASADPNAKATDKNQANTTTPAQAGLEDPRKRLGMPGEERDARLALRRAGDSSWLLDWAAQLAQMRRTYLKSRRIDDSPDLLTTAAVIATGVALLAGLFALYALYKYWAPH